MLEIVAKASFCLQSHWHVGVHRKKGNNKINVDKEGDKNKQTKGNTIIEYKSDIFHVFKELVKC